METQPTKPTEPQQSRVVTKQKVKTRPAVIVLSVLLLAALAGLGLLGYSLYQQQQITGDLQSKLTLTEESLVAANRDDIAMNHSQQEADKLPNFGTFISSYNAMLAASLNVSIDHVKEDQSIMQALKDHYKTQTLPEDVAVLSIYQVVKPQTPPTGDYYALVYWPAGEKPASFVSLVKPKGGAWKYEEMR